MKDLADSGSALHQYKYGFSGNPIRKVRNPVLQRKPLIPCKDSSYYIVYFPMAFVLVR